MDEEYNEYFDTSLKFSEKNYGCHIVSRQIYTSSEEMQLLVKIYIIVSILFKKLYSFVKSYLNTK
jgi:hypothetical protein